MNDVKKCLNYQKNLPKGLRRKYYSVISKDKFV